MPDGNRRALSTRLIEHDSPDRVNASNPSITDSVQTGAVRNCGTSSGGSEKSAIHAEHAAATYSARSDIRGCQYHGTYTWPVVRAKHQANLMFVLDDLAGWESAMVAELKSAKFRGAWIRIHDSGDFFSDAYLQAWLRICRARPDTNFYAYSKEVVRIRRLVEPSPPPNFLWVFSYGGTQDSALNPAVDRVADVFPDELAITEAGWASQEASDLLAVLGPRLVGVPANRIPTYLKRLAGRRFSEWQAEVDAERAAVRRRRHLRLVVDDNGQSEQRDAA